jgi:hypothetical protein
MSPKNPPNPNNVNPYSFLNNLFFWVCEERGEGDKILPLTGALEIEDAC